MPTSNISLCSTTTPYLIYLLSNLNPYSTNIHAYHISASYLWNKLLYKKCINSFKSLLKKYPLTTAYRLLLFVSIFIIIY